MFGENLKRIKEYFGIFMLLSLYSIVYKDVERMDLESSIPDCNDGIFFENILFN